MVSEVIARPGFVWANMHLWEADLNEMGLYRVGSKFRFGKQSIRRCKQWFVEQGVDLDSAYYRQWRRVAKAAQQGEAAAAEEYSRCLSEDRM